MKNLLCKLGIHRPLLGHFFYFQDKIVRVYVARCPCGRIYMVDRIGKYSGTKVLAYNQNVDFDDLRRQAMFYSSSILN